MYTYYQEVKSNKHFYFSSEICEYFGIYTVTDKPHVRFFAKYYSDHDTSEQKLYYNTSKGLTRVYPDGDIINGFAEFMMNQVKDMLKADVQSIKTTIKYGNKCYNIVIKVERFTKAYDN